MNRRLVSSGLVALATLGLLTACVSSPTSEPVTLPSGPPAIANPATATPIKHLVVIYDENVSFDHYFGTYPRATNTDGLRFTALADTPTPTNLLANNLLADNPNEFAPFRLKPSQAVTCDQDHSYAPEQEAADGGKNDKAVQFTTGDTCGLGGSFSTVGLTMGYYDGNTVTGLWNYAQAYALSDNSYGSTFGPSTPGALNLIAGQTHGIRGLDPKTGAVVDNPFFASSVAKDHVGTVTQDVDPAYDDCSGNDHTSPLSVGAMSGKNIGDLLDAKGITWGWFQGGFAPTTPATVNAAARCDARHTNVAGLGSKDYVPHQNPFAYYESTSNRHHLPPTSVAAVGRTDRANHNYDLTEFDRALTAGRYAVGQLPEARSLPERACGQLRPDRRAAFSGQPDQRDREVEVLGLDRHRYRLRRLGRLVRPAEFSHPERVPRLQMANSLAGDQPMCVNAAVRRECSVDMKTAAVRVHACRSS